MTRFHEPAQSPNTAQKLPQNIMTVRQSKTPCKYNVTYFYRCLYVPPSNTEGQGVHRDSHINKTFEAHICGSQSRG